MNVGVKLNIFKILENRVNGRLDTSLRRQAQSGKDVSIQVKCVNLLRVQ